MKGGRLILIIVLGITVILVAAIFIFFYSESKNNQSKITTPVINSKSTAPNPQDLQNGDYVIFQTPTGSVSIKNIFKEVIVNANGATQPIILNQNEFYTVSYNFEGNYFGIVLNQKPVAQYRPLAEQDLLDSLGISKQDSCKLPVTETVPLSVDDQNGGNINYGLSYCPNGLPMQ